MAVGRRQRNGRGGSPSRRAVLRRAAAGLAMGGGVALATGAPAVARTRGEIDSGVDAALNELFRIRPDLQNLFRRAEGVLVIPDIVKAGFILGGAYGEGALLVAGTTDSYWSYGGASVGFQAGVQRTRQALFFMTPSALNRFRSGDTFELGAEAELTVIDAGAEVSIDTTKGLKPVIVVVYGRQGLLGGASVAGGAYNRLYR